MKEIEAGADDLLKKSLATEISNGPKVALLRQRLGMLLRAGDNRRAGSVFRQIQDISGEAGLNAELVDAHMLLGDHEWDHGKSRTEAMKAYIAALVPASAIGIEVMIQTGTHALQRLLSIDPANRVLQIERIHSSLQKWLLRHVGDEQSDVSSQMALWPLRIALHIARDPNGQVMSSSREMTKLLETEIFDVIRRNRQAPREDHV